MMCWRNITIWDKIRNLTKKEFYNIPIYDNKYITTKIELFNNVIYKNFYDSEIPKEGMYCVCLSVITINCIVKISRK